MSKNPIPPKEINDPKAHQDHELKGAHIKEPPRDPRGKKKRGDMRHS